jgi:uncharacterized 2Fe-2S/4Fe-4S cluster protein (DUF4445 family)
LRTGKVAARLSAVNRQREFGGDMISRIQRASGGDLSLLSRCVRKQIAEGIAALCAEAPGAGRDIRKIAIAGNTAMLHLILGLSCQSLGKAPFTPVTLDTVFLNSREIVGEDLLGTPALSELCCETVNLPGISSYVGAGIAAGIFFCRTAQASGPGGVHGHWYQRRNCHCA